MNWKNDYAQDNRGIQSTIEFDLAVQKPQRFVISPKLLQFSRISVETICIGATGTAGTLTIHETNSATGSSALNYTTGTTVALGVNSNSYNKITDIASSYIAIEFPATVGAVGKIKLIITGKE